MKVRLSVAALCAFAAASCSGTPAAEPSPAGGAVTVASPSTPKPAPTPPPLLTVKQAAAAYLRIVAAYNQCLVPFNATVSTLPPPDLAAAKQAAARCATANRRFGLDLLQTRWPADVKPTADQFAAAVAANQVFWRAMANADTAVVFVDNYVRQDKDKAAGLAELLRQKLGLGEAPDVS